MVRILYGGVAGAVLVALELSVLRVIAVPPTVAEAFGLALAWSAFLVCVVGVVRLMARSGPPRLGELLAYHLVYGVGLGVWIRVTWIT